MDLKKTVVQRGKVPTILNVENKPEASTISKFPKNCYAVVSKCYEGPLLAVIRFATPALLVDDFRVPLPTEVQKMLRDFKESPVLRNLLAVKKAGPIITEMPVMVYWDEETADGGRVINTFSFEHGFLDKDVYDSCGEHKQHACYWPNGKFTIYQYEDGDVETIEGTHSFMSDSPTADACMRK